MISLYFNCKLIDEDIAKEKIDAGYFYPIAIPRVSRPQQITQYSILLKTIHSYSSIEFDVAYFNIEIDRCDECMEAEIRSLIAENFSAKLIVVNMTRPSTLETWQANVSSVSKAIGKNNPVLVVMNHDHPFVDYSAENFASLVGKLFPASANNFGKAFCYTHAPEVISWAVNGRGGIKYIEEARGIYRGGPINQWIDAIYVMTMETLSYVWSRAEFSGSYIGRLDWPGVRYSNLGLVTYVFPREFFKHYDGYNHLTGMRLISEITADSTTPKKFPKSENISDQVVFYYERWLDTQLLSVRDVMRSKEFSGGSRKSIFVMAIEDSLKLFKIGYLELDAKMGFINKEDICIIENLLRSHIYFFSNDLYNSIKTDIDLMGDDIISKSKKFIPSACIIILLFARRAFSRFIWKFNH